MSQEKRKSNTSTFAFTSMLTAMVQKKRAVTRAISKVILKEAFLKRYTYLMPSMHFMKKDARKLHHLFQISLICAEATLLLLVLQAIP
jgi:hypothetical protein